MLSVITQAHIDALDLAIAQGLTTKRIEFDGTVHELRSVREIKEMRAWMVAQFNGSAHVTHRYAATSKGV